MACRRGCADSCAAGHDALHASSVGFCNTFGGATTTPSHSWARTWRLACSGSAQASSPKVCEEVTRRLHRHHRGLPCACCGAGARQDDPKRSRFGRRYSTWCLGASIGDEMGVWTRPDESGGSHPDRVGDDRRGGRRPACHEPLDIACHAGGSSRPATSLPIRRCLTCRCAGAGVCGECPGRCLGIGRPDGQLGRRRRHSSGRWWSRRGWCR